MRERERAKEGEGFANVSGIGNLTRKDGFDGEGGFSRGEKDKRERRSPSLSPRDWPNHFLFHLFFFFSFFLGRGNPFCPSLTSVKTLFVPSLKQGFIDNFFSHHL